LFPTSLPGSFAVAKTGLWRGELTRSTSRGPKLLHYSAAVFQSVINDLKNERPDILLVPGDLTKDGEIVSHQGVADKLAEMEAMGTKCLLFPVIMT
jgi:3',5'-cyclic AMP phosphodiesterase CpdA